MGRVLDIALDIAQAMAYMHTKGIIHGVISHHLSPPRPDPVAYERNHTCLRKEPYMHMEGTIHAYGRNHTCIWKEPYMHTQETIHAYERNHTCIGKEPYMRTNGTIHAYGRNHTCMRRKYTCIRKDLYRESPPISLRRIRPTPKHTDMSKTNMYLRTGMNGSMLMKESLLAYQCVLVDECIISHLTLCTYQV
jgi:hypothetical protein